MTTIRCLSSLCVTAIFGVLVGCGSVAPQTAIAPPKAAPVAKAKPTVAEIRAQLAAHRKLQLARLEAYAKLGEFPRNLTTPGTAHLFKDDDGRLCAVANLVHQDGLDALVDATAKTHNDVVLADVKDGPLMDWVLASGLTLEEVAEIQLPAARVVWEESNEAPPPASQPVEPPPLTVAQMQAQVRNHLAGVAQVIAASTEKSLDVAVARFEASAIAEQPIAMGDAE